MKRNTLDDGWVEALFPQSACACTSMALCACVHVCVIRYILQSFSFYPPPSSELAPSLWRAEHAQLPTHNPLPSPTQLYSEDTLHPLRVASCSSHASRLVSDLVHPCECIEKSAPPHWGRKWEAFDSNCQWQNWFEDMFKVFSNLVEAADSYCYRVYRQIIFRSKILTAFWKYSVSFVWISFDCCLGNNYSSWHPY